MRILGGYQNTKNSNEDFALTPYIFSVMVRVEKTRAFGLGICWGYYAAYLGIGFNVPKSFKSFKRYKNKTTT